MRIFRRDRLGASLTLRACALVLVGFYLLASGRAVVPELCATQRALAAANAAEQVCSISDASCCPSTMPEHTDDTDSDPARESGCAFCHLAKATFEAPEIVRFEAPPELSEPALPAWHAQVSGFLPFDPTPSRAPPAA